MSAVPPPPPAVPGSKVPAGSPAHPADGLSEVAGVGGIPAAADDQSDDDAGNDRPSRVIPLLLGLVVLLLALIIAVKVFRPTVAGWLGRTPEQALARQIELLKKDGPRENRMAAAQELVKMGDAAVIAALDATNAVSAQDHSAQFSLPVWQALADVGPGVMPALLKAAESPQDNIRAAAVGTLREMGPAAEPAMTVLVALVDDKNQWVAGFACDALGNLGPKATVAAVKALIQVVQQPESPLRRRAIVALGRIGPPARSTVPVLLRIRQRDRDKDICDAAAVALNEIDLRRMVDDATRHADAEVRELIRRLQGEDQFEAPDAARSLGKRGPGAKAAIPALAMALKAKDKWLREAAATALGAIGPEARTVLPALQRAADDKEPEVRDAAQKAIEKIGS